MNSAEFLEFLKEPSQSVASRVSIKPYVSLIAVESNYACWTMSDKNYR